MPPRSRTPTRTRPRCRCGPCRSPPSHGALFFMDLEQQLASGRPEARSITFTDLDVTNGGRSLDGYAAVYGQETDLGQWTEVIVAPAFRGAPERSGNIPMLWDHNAGLPPL